MLANLEAVVMTQFQLSYLCGIAPAKVFQYLLGKLTEWGCKLEDDEPMATNLLQNWCQNYMVNLM